MARHGRHELTNLVLTRAQVDELVERMLKSSGRRIDLSQPFVDAMLPEGHRLGCGGCGSRQRARLLTVPGCVGSGTVPLPATIPGMEPWMLDPEAAWWATLRRADEHLIVVADLFHDFQATEPYTLTPEDTDNPDEVAYRLRVHREAPAELMTVVADVLHNLGSALDSLAFGLAVRSVDRELTGRRRREQHSSPSAAAHTYGEFFGDGKRPDKWQRMRGDLYGPRARKALRAGQPFYSAEQAVVVDGRRTPSALRRQPRLVGTSATPAPEQHRQAPAAACAACGVAGLVLLRQRRRRQHPVSVGPDATRERHDPVLLDRAEGELPVGGAFGGPPGGVGAGGALPAFGVAVAGHEPFVAVVGDPDLDPRHGASREARKWRCPHSVRKRCPERRRTSAKVGGNSM